MEGVQPCTPQDFWFVFASEKEGIYTLIKLNQDGLRIESQF